MTPISIEIIERKLSRINEDMDMLGEIAALSYGEYVKRPFYRKAAERMIQEVVEAAVDINTHILVESGFPAPQDYYHTFIDVAEKVKAFDLGFATAIAPSVGLRNRIVHEYDRLDHAVIFTSIRGVLEMYPRYVQAVLQYLKDLEAKETGE